MPRNSSGTYSLPESPFVPSTPISSTAVNSDLSDIGVALTDSLSRSGDGGMLSQLELAPGGFVYSGDSDTGISRAGSNTQVITCGGINVISATPSGATVAGALDVTGGALTVGGVSIRATPIGAVMMWSLSSAPTGWLFPGTYSRVTYAALWAAAAADIALGNTFYGTGDGSTTFTIGTMDGYAPVGVDAAAARLPGVANIGATTGASSVTLAANQIPSLTSVNASQAISVVSTVSSIVKDTGGISSSNAGGGSHGQFTDVSAVSEGSVASTGNNSISVAYANGGQQVTPIVQPSRAFKFIIYAGA